MTFQDRRYAIHQLQRLHGLAVIGTLMLMFGAANAILMRFPPVSLVLVIAAMIEVPVCTSNLHRHRTTTIAARDCFVPIVEE